MGCDCQEGKLGLEVSGDKARVPRGLEVKKWERENSHQEPERGVGQAGHK